MGLPQTNLIEDRLLARIAELKRTLVPFAKLLQKHHEHMADTVIVFGIADATITVGDLRKAYEDTDRLRG